MKKINYFVGLLLVMLAFVFVVSCNDDDEESLEQQWASVLDNHGCAYDFSDAGYCFGDGGGISKKTLKKCSLAMDGSTTPHGKLPGMEKDCLTNITAA